MTDYELVETEGGKEVRVPYERACKDYVFGWISALAMCTLLFLTIAVQTSGTIQRTAFTFVYVFVAVATALVGVYRYHPVRFYEWVER